MQPFHVIHFIKLTIILFQWSRPGEANQQDPTSLLLGTVEWQKAISSYRYSILVPQKSWGHSFLHPPPPLPHMHLKPLHCLGGVCVVVIWVFPGAKSGCGGSHTLQIKLIYTGYNYYIAQYRGYNLLLCSIPKSIVAYKLVYTVCLLLP